MAVLATMDVPMDIAAALSYQSEGLRVAAWIVIVTSGIVIAVVGFLNKRGLTYNALHGCYEAPRLSAWVILLGSVLGQFDPIVEAWRPLAAWLSFEGDSTSARTASDSTPPQPTPSQAGAVGWRQRLRARFMERTQGWRSSVTVSKDNYATVAESATEGLAQAIIQAGVLFNDSSSSSSLVAVSLGITVALLAAKARVMLPIPHSLTLYVGLACLVGADAVCLFFVLAWIVGFGGVSWLAAIFDLKLTLVVVTTILYGGYHVLNYLCFSRICRPKVATVRVITLDQRKRTFLMRARITSLTGGATESGMQFKVYFDIANATLLNTLRALLRLAVVWLACLAGTWAFAALPVAIHFAVLDQAGRPACGSSTLDSLVAVRICGQQQRIVAAYPLLFLFQLVTVGFLPFLEAPTGLSSAARDFVAFARVLYSMLVAIGWGCVVAGVKSSNAGRGLAIASQVDSQQGAKPDSPESHGQEFIDAEVLEAAKESVRAIQRQKCTRVLDGASETVNPLVRASSESKSGVSTTGAGDVDANAHVDNRARAHGRHQTQPGSVLHPVAVVVSYTRPGGPTKEEETVTAACLPSFSGGEERCKQPVLCLRCRLYILYHFAVLVFLLLCYALVRATM